MRLIAGIAACIVFTGPLAAGCSGSEPAMPEGHQAAVEESPVFAVLPQGQTRKSDLIELTAPSLRPVAGRRVPLDEHGYPWAFSPDGSSIVVGGAGSLRFVDVERMHTLGDLEVGGAHVSAMAWVEPRRLLVDRRSDTGAAALLLVDPAIPRIVRRQPIPGAVMASASTPKGLALLLAPSSRIGPSRLLIADVRGDPRSVPLTEIEAGSEAEETEDDSEPPIEHVQSPGLAVDRAGQRAFVVSGRGPVAEVDLADLSVDYHSPEKQVSLLGRLRNWLDPAAEAKGLIEGSFRQAAWLGDDLVAVTGWDSQVTSDDGSLQETKSPAGLELIDTRDWSARTLDEGASVLSFVKGTILAYGSLYDSAEGEFEGMGLSAYGLDGERRFHQLGREAVARVVPVGAYLLVEREKAVSGMLQELDRMPIVDLRSGRVVKEIRNLPCGAALWCLAVPGWPPPA